MRYVYSFSPHSLVPLSLTPTPCRCSTFPTQLTCAHLSPFIVNIVVDKFGMLGPVIFKKINIFQ